MNIRTATLASILTTLLFAVAAASVPAQGIDLRSEPESALGQGSGQGSALEQGANPESFPYLDPGRSSKGRSHAALVAKARERGLVPVIVRLAVDADIPAAMFTAQVALASMLNPKPSNVASVRSPAPSSAFPTG